MSGRTNYKAVAWTIGGSDSGAGAGIQADLKTMNAIGVYGCSVISCITAQNTQRVASVAAVDDDILIAQLRTLLEDLPPLALKSGAFGSARAVSVFSDFISKLSAFYVCDPVLFSSSGNRLGDEASFDAIRSELLPRVDLLTPNLSEAAALLGGKYSELCSNNSELFCAELDTDRHCNLVEEAARALLDLGVKAVLIKGGHWSGPYSQDFYCEAGQAFWLSSPRIESRSTHGTGCTLSAAITGLKALGHSTADAVVLAKAYLNQCLRNAPGLGGGFGPLRHANWQDEPESMPWLTASAAAGRRRPEFIREERTGFYPIVSRFDRLEELLKAGARTIQLRVKDLSGDALENEVQRSIEIARFYGGRLYINDYWRLALKYKGYGVHLGQEDLETADLSLIERGRLRLGVSTHCPSEVARALALRPSYIAVGPVHATSTKEMKFAPQGLEGFKFWRGLLDYPLVAIGGIFLSNADELIAAGADGIAVVRDIAVADIEDRVKQWCLKFPHISFSAHQPISNAVL